jgi:predicted DNA-binding protein with PD1-like motif
MRFPPERAARICAAALLALACAGCGSVDGAGDGGRGDRAVENHPRAFVLRLHPGDDLRATLQRYASEQGIEAAAVASCAGSLKRATIRFADEHDTTTVEGPLEIVSLSGTLSRAGSHLHIAVADGRGATSGGHLQDGAIVYTTAEVVLLAMPSLHFTRERDPESGYAELKIR